MKGVHEWLATSSGAVMAVVAVVTLLVGTGLVRESIRYAAEEDAAVYVRKGSVPARGRLLCAGGEPIAADPSRPGHFPVASRSAGRGCVFFDADTGLMSPAFELQFVGGLMVVDISVPATRQPD